MNRRRFLAHSALAGCAGPLTVGRSLGAPSPTAPTPASAAVVGATQAFHRDFVSYRAGLEYFVLGNGHIQVVLKAAEATGVGDRHLQFDLGPLAPGAERAITLVQSIGDEPTRVAAGGLRPLSRDLRARLAGRLAVSIPVRRARESRSRKSRAGVARVALAG